VAEKSWASDCELRSKVVGSIPGHHCQQFFNPGSQKNQQGTSQGNSSLHKFLSWDSYKGVGCASTLPESILYKIIINISESVWTWEGHLVNLRRLLWLRGHRSLYNHYRYLSLNS